MKYGFTEPENPHDVVSISFEDAAKFFNLSRERIEYWLSTARSVAKLSIDDSMERIEDDESDDEDYEDETYFQITGEGNIDKMLLSLAKFALVSEDTFQQWIKADSIRGAKLLFESVDLEEKVADLVDGLLKTKLDKYCPEAKVQEMISTSDDVFLMYCKTILDSELNIVKRARSGLK